MLIPGLSAAALAGKLTMVDMGMADYAEISEIDVSMNDYACRQDDIASIDEAWD